VGDRTVEEAERSGVEELPAGPLQPVERGMGQVHWFEGSVLLPAGGLYYEPAAGIPDHRAM